MKSFLTTALLGLVTFIMVGALVSCDHNDKSKANVTNNTSAAKK